MCTVNVLAACVVPAGTVFGPQVSVPFAIAHVPPQPRPWLAICQLRPAFVGSVSESDTPYASPVPEFETVSVKPIGSPAFTCAASAAFTILTFGAATHVEAPDWSPPPFAIVTEPVLFTTPELGQSPPVAAVVGDVMCTVNVLAAWLVPAGTVSGPQVSVPFAIAHELPQPA